MLPSTVCESCWLEGHSLPAPEVHAHGQSGPRRSLAYLQRRAQHLLCLFTFALVSLLHVHSLAYAVASRSYPTSRRAEKMGSREGNLLRCPLHFEQHLEATFAQSCVHPLTQKPLSPSQSVPMRRRWLSHAQSNSADASIKYKAPPMPPDRYMACNVARTLCSTHHVDHQDVSSRQATGSPLQSASASREHSAAQVKM